MIGVHCINHTTNLAMQTLRMYSKASMLIFHTIFKKNLEFYKLIHIVEITHSLEHSNSLDFYVVVNKQSVECVFRIFIIFFNWSLH